ncbi:MAG: hypothetical protein HW388_1219 [Dehalococcoidia bacterium]|nr:hypothetical protein [Dehalococcoidia bacterium]
MERAPGVLALGLLLTAASIALIMRATPEGLWGSSVAADDGEIGSTVPIPPPKRPTPQPPTPTPLETAVPTSSLVSLDLTNLSLSPGTRVQTTTGDLIPLTNKGIRIEADPAGAQRVVFPFALTPGQEVLAFHDPESGIVWLPSSTGAEGDTLTIPLAGNQGDGGLTIGLGRLQSNGQEAWAPVLGAGLWVSSQSGAVQLLAELRSLPSNIALEIRGVAPDSGLVSALDEATSTLSMGIASIAYAVKIETNLDGKIASARVDMAVDEGWARAWPQDRIRIARISATGVGRILETAPGGEEAQGLARFRAESGEGFSTFALVALGELTHRESGSGLPWALGLSIGLGVVALVGLATGAFMLVASGRRGKNPGV